MTPQTLKKLRLARDLTREELAKELGCSAGAIVQWETDETKAGHRSIPTWVEEKMLRTIKVTLPLDELHWLLTEALTTGQSAESILADALRLWLHNRQKPVSQANVIEAKQDFTKPSPAPLYGGRLPQQHVAEEHEK